MTEEVKEIAQLEGVILEKFDKLNGAIEKANEEAKLAGSVSTESKNAINSVSEKLNELTDRVMEVEQKGASVVEAKDAPIDIGAEFIKSDSFKDLVEGRTGRARLNLKTAIINATGQNQPLVPADRLAGINTLPNRVLRIRDLLPASQTSSNLIEFVRENAFTNNAGPQVAGSPQAFENVTKPESAITFTLATEAVTTLAHFIPASKQVLEDSAQLQSYISGRLMYGLKLKEETQLLSGTGANGQLNGLITQATAYSPESPNLSNKLDIIRDAIAQAHVSEYMPDGIVLNPADWDAIERLHVGASDDRYVVGDPARAMTPTIWGLPVVISNSISSGTFLLGSFGMGAEIKDRASAMVEVSLENSDNFEKNMCTIRAEERIALVVYRTEAFITGSL